MTGGPIMIMAGGTGGHVFPGLAVAATLRERQHPIVWIGTHRGLESTLVPEHGIDIDWISISGIRSSGLAAWLAAPFKIVFAIAQAMRIFHRCRPGAVLGLGGFVSGPGGIAAWLTRRPLLIHEQNAIAGTTNRLLARFAKQVFEAFPGSFPASVEASWIGNPVRREIASLPPPRERSIAAPHRRVRVLVLGGSRGARVLNRVLPPAVKGLSALRNPEIRHQSGSAVEETAASYTEAGIDAGVEAFIDDMAAAYAWADLVVARAGALTVTELAACGVGAILVPFPYAVDDHQTENARRFVAAGAAVLIPERELDAGRLGRELERLLSDRGLLLRMAEQARAQARPDAAEQLADACLRYAGGAS